MKKIIWGLAVLTGLSMSARSAVLDDAAALWKFDYASNGLSAAYTEMTDSSGNGHNATAWNNPGVTNISWATVPAVGPGGAEAVDPFDSIGRGISLQPILVASGDTDTVATVGYTVANFSVSQAATIATRFRWDGYISDDSSAQMAWLYANGFASSNGWLFGIQNSGTEARLKLFSLGSGFQTADSGVTIQSGYWYDVVTVLNSDADPATTDTVNFYLFREGDSLFETNVSAKLTVTSGLNTLIGNETMGTGAGNQRKAFDGTLDYIAVWDRALTPTEAESLIIPEPGTALLTLAGLAAFALRRRRT